MVEEITTRTVPTPSQPARLASREERRTTTAEATPRPTEFRPAEAEERTRPEDAAGGPPGVPAVQGQGIRPSISFNEEAARFVYLGINAETREVVRQFPTEQALRQIAYFRRTSGELVDEKT